MELMTNVSEPSPSYIHHVLKLQLIGVEERKTCPVVIPWQEHVVKETGTAGPVWRDMNKLAAQMLTPRAVLPHTPSAEMPWWRSLGLSSGQTVLVLELLGILENCLSALSIRDYSGSILV